MKLNYHGNHTPSPQPCPPLNFPRGWHSGAAERQFLPKSATPSPIFDSYADACMATLIASEALAAAACKDLLDR